MFDWFLGKIGIGDLRDRVRSLESRVESIEGEVSRGMQRLGQYKGRTDKELKLMKGQVIDLLGSVDSILKTQENRESLERAAQLKRRLKNNLTRINNSMKKGARKR